MNIQGIKAGVQTTELDIVPVAITPPTNARVHAITSASNEDSAVAVAQVETATVVGDITGDGNATVIVTSAGMAGSPKTVSVAVVAGTAQVETATVVGTIAADGAGNANVVVTGALIAGSPLLVEVAVANDDTAAQVGGKIRTALGLVSAITDEYTISGADENIILTCDTTTGNDSTLNISIDNGTCSGLTAAPESVATVAGVATDTPSLTAVKIKAALDADAAIGHPTTGKFTVTTDGADVILTANVAAANDATLNVDINNGTCTGLTDAPTSANTTAGSAASGASKIKIIGVDENWNEVSEIVTLAGLTAVNTTNSYWFINYMYVYNSTVNTGAITATAATDSTVSCTISAAAGESQQAYQMAVNEDIEVTNLELNVVNATGDAITTFKVKVKEHFGGWRTKKVINIIDSNVIYDIDLQVQVPKRALVKVTAVNTAGTSLVGASFTMAKKS